MRGAYINLASLRRNGAEVRTPVWFATIDTKLYVFTDGTSAKVKRIRANQRVRVAECDVVGKLLGDWRDGVARVVDDPAVIAVAYAGLRAKYGWQMWGVDFVSRLAGRIGRRVILELVLAD